MACQNTKTCPNACPIVGYCIKNLFLALETHELHQPEIIRQLRGTTATITEEEGIKPSQVRDWLNDKYRDSRVQPVNAAHQPVDLDMDCLEPSDEVLDAGNSEKHDENLREFFRTNACKKPCGAGRVFVTKPWHKQFVTMASVIGVAYPQKAQWWPRMINGKYVDPRVANDNHPCRPQ